ncbi:MAG: 23S rRNA (pseudouridine(1915)-N(3))-methyltransferase RlmH [Bacilli bacterium]|nr:23S rRNA (pseudouridine(1915)-N(3))-methyltransferase RlmH [Bacilli bacterium]
MDIKLIVVGKIKESYLNEAIKEYVKRVKPMANLNIIEIKECTYNESVKNLKEEAKLILNNISDNDFVITLEINGKELTSVELSEYISKHYLYNNKVLTFIIGSSDGMDESVKARSNYKLSFSKMTFPHQLMRVIFLEQLYRALSIINNMKYHK